MLRAVSPGGAGGGRPPVNIEVNFITGNGKSAFDIEREKAAALKADITEINALMGNMGRGAPGGGGGGPIGAPAGGATVGGRGRGARPASIPSTGFNPAAATPAEQAAGEMYGPPRPTPMGNEWWRTAPATTYTNYGASSPVPAWSSGLPAGHPARRDYGSQAYGPSRPPVDPLAGINARNEAAATVRRQAAIAAEVAAKQRATAAVAAETSAIAAETAAIRASAAPSALGGAIGGAAVPFGFAAAASALTLHNITNDVTGGGPAGFEVGLMQSLERGVRPGSMASAIPGAVFRNANIVNRFLPGGQNAQRGLQAAFDYGIRGPLNGVFGVGGLNDQEDRLRSQMTRLASDQRWANAEDARFSLDMGSQLAAAGRQAQVSGTLEDAIAASRTRQGILSRGLSATATDDPQSGYRLQGRQRADTISSLIEEKSSEVQLARQAHEATVSTWRTVLESQNKVLELRTQEVALVEKQVAARTAGYAEQTPGELRGLERAYKDLKDGDGRLSPRNRTLLNRDGSFRDDPELQRINRERVEQYAPTFSAAILQKPLTDAQSSLERIQTAVENTSEQMAGIVHKSADQVNTLKTAFLKSLEGLAAQWLEAAKDAIDEMAAQNNAKQASPTGAPGG